MYLEKFILPIENEENMIRKRMAYNGGKCGYIDNIYPCNIFSKKQLYEINFDTITILYGGNGSGKSTLLNLIANKLRLNLIAFQTAVESSPATISSTICSPSGQTISTSQKILSMPGTSGPD